MREDQFLAFTEHYVKFLREEIAHVNRELDELEDYKAGRRRSNAPLGSRFYSNVGHRLATLLVTMERWGQADS